MRLFSSMRSRFALAGAAGVVVLVGGLSFVSAGSASAAVVKPPVNGQFDYQIGGAYTPAASVQIVDRDRSQKPVSGKYNICYVNAFQTQPDDRSWWSTNHADLLVKKSNGSLLVDPDWPDEYLMDISTAAKRDALMAIVGPWIDGCATSKFQAVEPDNIDSYTRSNGVLTQTNAISWATALASRAHAKGLAIAQKNTAELGSLGRDTAKFDFAIAEECNVADYNECGDYQAVYGNNVIEIEYTDNAKSAYTKSCSTRGSAISIILRDREVVPAGNSAYHYEYC
ncbi:endo alpha-1,4 polygalactosaminidase [Kineosporia mesophila]|uniref:Endo alpha-1,4 polygalactosaminidase n=2 Tax=Kineosporia mesophila TaxID=566012 RepID=A0ABP7AKT8_9ACTN